MARNPQPRKQTAFHLSMTSRFFIPSLTNTLQFIVMMKIYGA